MSGSQQQHIHASAFHLRAFADGEGRIARVTASGETEITTPRGAGILKNSITDREVAPVDRFWFEEALARLESEIAPQIKRAIVAVQLGRLNRDDENAFTTYPALQYARSEHQGEWIADIRARNPDAEAGVVSVRAALLAAQFERLAETYAYSCFFRCDLPLAHPELPFVPFEVDGIVGLMIAMTPRILFARATGSFDLEDVAKFYWQRLTGMPAEWKAVLCNTHDAPAVAALCVAIAAARSGAPGE